MFLVQVTFNLAYEVGVSIQNKIAKLVKAIVRGPLFRKTNLKEEGKLSLASSPCYGISPRCGAEDYLWAKGIFLGLLFSVPKVNDTNPT